MELAQHGIVVLDELDKLASKGKGHSEVGNKGVQHRLLKIIEGFF